MSRPACASSAFAGATEFTQLLNNGELVSLGGQQATEIANQVKQISNQVVQIENQIRIYQNMLQNTRVLPENVWGQAKSDLARLRATVNRGQAIAFSMGNLDAVFKERFPSYLEFRSRQSSEQDLASAYGNWSKTNRDTIEATLGAAGLTAEDFAGEEATMETLQAQASSAVGQMQALQVGHEIAVQQVAQMQKLRGLISQQVAMMGTWYQTRQSQQDLAGARAERFFDATPPSYRDGAAMRLDF